MNAEHKRVCVISIVHRLNNARIHYKEVRTLARAEYRVLLIAREADVLSTDCVDIQLFSEPGNRISRVFNLGSHALARVLSFIASVYHIHDPEIMSVALILKIFTAAHVVYDVHKYVPRDMLCKSWIRNPLRRIVAALAAFIEWAAGRIFDGIFSVEPVTYR